MDIQLSRDADMIVCQIYKEYLKRIESGTPKADAKIFKDVDGFIKTYFPNKALFLLFDLFDYLLYFRSMCVNFRYKAFRCIV